MYDENSGYDWSEYPFVISSYTGGYNSIATENVGTYQVKIVANEESVIVSECFAKAVSKCMLVCTATRTENMPHVTYTLDKTWKEIREACRKGQTVNIVYASPYNNGIRCDAVIYTDYSYNDSEYIVTIGTKYYEQMMSVTHGTADTFIADSENGYPYIVFTLQG